MISIVCVIFSFFIAVSGVTVVGVTVGDDVEDGVVQAYLKAGNGRYEMAGGVAERDNNTQDCISGKDSVVYCLSFDGALSLYHLGDPTHIRTTTYPNLVSPGKYRVAFSGSWLLAAANDTVISINVGTLQVVVTPIAFKGIKEMSLSAPHMIVVADNGTAGWFSFDKMGGGVVAEGVYPELVRSVILRGASYAAVHSDNVVCGGNISERREDYCVLPSQAEEDSNFLIAWMGVRVALFYCSERCALQHLGVVGYEDDRGTYVYENLITTSGDGLNESDLLSLDYAENSFFVLSRAALAVFTVSPSAPPRLHRSPFCACTKLLFVAEAAPILAEDGRNPLYLQIGIAMACATVLLVACVRLVVSTVAEGGEEEEEEDGDEEKDPKNPRQPGERDCLVVPKVRC